VHKYLTPNPCSFFSLDEVSLPSATQNSHQPPEGFFIVDLVCAFQNQSHLNQKNRYPTCISSRTIVFPTINTADQVPVRENVATAGEPRYQ
jgi:hypothetical protein